MNENESEFLLKLLSKLNSKIEVEHIISYILYALIDFTKADIAVIRLQETSQNDIYLVHDTKNIQQEQSYSCSVDESELINLGLTHLCKNENNSIQNIMEYIATDGSFYCNDIFELADDCVIQKEYISNSYRSISIIPIRINGDLLGLLQLAFLEPKEWNTLYISFLEHVCKFIAIAVHRGQITRKIKEKEKIEIAFATIGTTLHKLNQPLQAISGYIEILLRNLSDTSDFYHYVQLLEYSSQKMVEEMRTLAAIKEINLINYANTNTKILET